MANPSKKRGSAAESAVVRWAREHGFRWADRQPLRGNRDAGDITLCPGVIVEVKCRRLPTGVPTAGDLAEWMRQTEAERVTAGAGIGILVVKRGGTTDVGRWFAYVSLGVMADLVGYASTLVERDESWAPWRTPVCLALADLATLLRAAGWGDRLEDGAA